MPVEFEVIPYSFNFYSPINIGTKILTKRTGLYVICKENKKKVGVGEIAPLAGLSKETYNDSIQECKKLLPALNNKISTQEDLYQVPLFLSASPSVQFGIESAVMSIQLNKHTKTNTINIQNLIQNISKISTPLTQCIKCKVGKKPFKEELNAYKTLMQNNPSTIFRFDANNRFSLNEASDFFNALPQNQIDYVEDPCKQVSEYETFHRNTGLPFAIDSLHAHESIPKKGLTALIIKPTIIGSQKAIETLLNRYSGIRTIFSSTFESHIGLQSIAKLCIRYGLENTIHGLGTYKFLKQPENLSYTEEKLFLESTKELLTWINQL